MTIVSPISTTSFKTYFDRDFIFGTGMNTVRDADITRAINLTLGMHNPGLWDNTSQATDIFYLLSAHYLVKIIDSCGGLIHGNGIKSTASGAILSKSAGPLSVSFSFPDKLSNDPILSDFLLTGYGKTFLSLVMPRLIGNVQTVTSDTNP